MVLVASLGEQLGRRRRQIWVALDVAVERSSAELLIGPAGYGALLSALEGIPTNLLANRLRVLETDGLVARRRGLEVGGSAALAGRLLTP